MRQLARFVQTTTEKKLYAMDYSEWLGSTETIVSVNVFVDSDTVPPFVIDPPQILNGAKGIAFFAYGGVVNKRYEISFEVTSSLGQVKEDKLLFTIVE